MKSRIAIIFIGLGKYDIFWPQFFESFSNNFCSECNLSFHVFTSNEIVNKNQYLNSKFYSNDFLGWPFSTLYRYHIILRAEADLKTSDYIVFFNANAVCVSKVSFEEFFGDPSSDCLVAGHHPGYYGLQPGSFPLETRKESSAYFSNADFYFQGCINGGSSKYFLEVCKELSCNIDSDLNSGIVALWHDESHWNSLINRLLRSGNIYLSLLKPDFLFPDNYRNVATIDPKIVMLDKRRWGGHHFLRLNAAKPSSLRLISLIKRIIRRFARMP